MDREVLEARRFSGADWVADWPGRRRLFRKLNGQMTPSSPALAKHGSLSKHPKTLLRISRRERRSRTLGWESQAGSTGKLTRRESGVTSSLLGTAVVPRALFAGPATSRVRSLGWCQHERRCAIRAEVRLSPWRIPQIDAGRNPPQMPQMDFVAPSTVYVDRTFYGARRTWREFAST